jgi:low molecular weight protein-tyrosine phosphatase
MVGAALRVCVVCLGNICRSPMAEIVLRNALTGMGVIVDSAGTATGHPGFPMHIEAYAALTARGYDGSGHEARQFEKEWLCERDLILAMDNSNLTDLRKLGGDDRVQMFGEEEIPDPYFGDAADFAHALDMIEAGIPAVVSRISDMLAG